MILKKINYNNFDKIANVYMSLNSIQKQKQKYKLYFFSLYMHKKLNYFRFFLKNKFFNYSNGQLLNKKIKKIKFFKKSTKSFGLTINTLNKKLAKAINMINIFYCKNYNFKNYLWIKKYIFLIKPQIYYTVISNSWNYISKKKKELRKKYCETCLKLQKQYNLFTVYLSFLKLSLYMEVTKITTALVGVISLNKIEMNYTIIIYLILSFYIIKSSKMVISVVLISVYTLIQRYSNFLNIFFLGFFKIHPLVFYTSSSMYFLSLNIKIVSLKIKQISILSASILALVLGSLWALYQINWGYYWSSDPIEFALLLIIIVFTVNLHSFQKTKLYKHTYFLCIILYIYLIRLGLIYTRHSFFNTSNFFFTEIKCVLIWGILSVLVSVKKQKNRVETATIAQYMLVIVIILLFLNYNFNKHVKYVINFTVTVWFVYIGLKVNWANLNSAITHVFLITFLIIFVSYKTQYTLKFCLTNILDNTNRVLWTKTLLTYYKNLIHYFNLNIKLTWNKNVNVINLERLNYTTTKKKLINHF